MPDKTVNIPGIGDVAFPDTMSDDEIVYAIKNSILRPLQQDPAPRPPIKPPGFPDIPGLRTFGSGVENLRSGFTAKDPLTAGLKTGLGFAELIASPFAAPFEVTQNLIGRSIEAGSQALGARPDIARGVAQSMERAIGLPFEAVGAATGAAGNVIGKGMKAVGIPDVKLTPGQKEAFDAINAFAATGLLGGAVTQGIGRIKARLQKGMPLEVKDIQIIREKSPAVAEKLDALVKEQTKDLPQITPLEKPIPPIKPPVETAKPAPSIKEVELLRKISREDATKAEQAKLKREGLSGEAPKPILREDIPPDVRVRIQDILDESGVNLKVDGPDGKPMKIPSLKKAIEEWNKDRGSEASFRAQALIESLLRADMEGTVELRPSKGQPSVQVPVEDLLAKKYERGSPETGDVSFEFGKKAGDPVKFKQTPAGEQGVLLSEQAKYPRPDQGVRSNIPLKEQIKGTMFDVTKPPGEQGGLFPVPETRGPRITPDKAANLSLKRFEEPARQGISDMTGAQELSAVEAQRRGVRPHSVTEMAAREQGDIVGKARRGEIERGRAFNAEQLEALDSEVNRVGKLTPEDILTKENPREVANLLRTTYGAHAEAGRALNILGKRVDPSVAQNFLKIAEQTKDPALKNAVNQAIDFLEKGKDIPPGLWDKVAEWGRNIKLASMSGMVRSLAGNSVMQAFRYPEQLGSSVVNKMLSAVTGKQRDRFAREIAADYIGTKSGMRDGFKRAWAMLKDSPTALSDNIFLEMEVPNSRGAIGGTLGRVVRTPQRAQGAVDLIFRVPAQRGAIGKLAVRQAFKEGLVDEAWAKRVDELIAKPTAEMVLQASLDSRYLTFQNPLGPVAAGVNQLRSVHPVMQLPVPFFSTATNLFKAMTERTPLAPLTPSFQQALAEAFRKPRTTKGSVEYGFERATGKKFESQIGNLSDKVSRMVAGTTFMVATGVVINKVLDAEITGRGPRSSTERDALFRTGWMPYSIRFGDRYVSYRGFEPLSGWLSMLADYSQGYKEEGIEEAITRSSINLIKNFAENPFLVGVRDIMEGLTDVEGKRAERAIAGFAVGMAVLTIVKQTKAVIDPTIRKSEGIVESIETQIPGLSKDLMPKRNVFGEPIEIEAPATRLVGVSTSTRKITPLETELARLKLNLGWPSDMYGGVKLSPEQHDKLITVAGGELKKTLTKLVQAPAWKHLTDGMKVDAIRRVQDAIRDVQRLVLLPDVKKEAIFQKAERELMGGTIDEAQREKTLNALRRAIGK